MIARENILQLETRREIYNFILKYPGLHLRELTRRTNISIGGLRYHLDFLKKQEIVTTKSDKRYTRYYASKNVGKDDKKILNLLQQKIPCKIVIMLQCVGPGDIYKTKATRVKARAKPSTFMKYYSKKEIVELTRYWDKPYDELFRLKKHRTTIDFHLEKLIDADIVKKVRIGKEIKYKLKDEDEIFAIFIKYKDALSNELIDTFLGWGESSWVTNGLERFLDVLFDIFPHPYHA